MTEKAKTPPLVETSLSVYAAPTVNVPAVEGVYVKGSAVPIEIEFERFVASALPER